MGDLSLHFSVSEFGLPEAKARRRGCEPADYPAEWIESRLKPLCAALEIVRTHRVQVVLTDLRHG